MKKYLLSFAVLIMAAISFTACSSDDDEDVWTKIGKGSLAKTSWAYSGERTFDGVQELEEYAVCFVNDKECVLMEKHTNKEKNIVEMEAYGEGTYTFDGEKAKMNTTSITRVEGEKVSTTPTSVQLEIRYDSKTKTLVISVDGDGKALKNVSFKEIKVPLPTHAS